MAVHIIHTGKDGRLKEQKGEDIAKIVAALGAADRIVLHFHGGLVNRKAATALANRLDPVYRAAGTEPAFFVWESGLLETIRNNVHEIGKEKVFKILVKLLLKHVAGKLLTTIDQKAAGRLTYPRDPEIDQETRKDDPYGDLAAPPDLEESTPTEIERLEKDLADPASGFDEEIRSIAASAMPDVQTEVDASKGVVVRSKASTRTLMSPDVIREIETDTERGSKGVIATTLAVLRAGKILKRVIQRFVHRRDHGVYPTIVEEILREFYVANIGAEIWHQMKKETADTFVDDGYEKGGRLVLGGLADALAAGRQPRITLVGHSTGAVFILNLLEHVEHLRKDGRWPADRKIDQIVFLAPACSFERMHDALTQRRDLFDKFRMFAMSDEKESSDRLFPPVYTRSLLYFVSGALEQEEGKSASDLPILGMQRYVAHPETYDQLEVGTFRAFLSEDPARAVWSVVDDGDGRRSNATSHGGFDDTDPADPGKHTTMASVRHLIEHGIQP